MTCTHHLAEKDTACADGACPICLREQLRLTIIDQANTEAEGNALRAEVTKLREALESIANNTCCDRCQEAALVAKAALWAGLK